jgi:hypothetical protein
MTSRALPWPMESGMTGGGGAEEVRLRQWGFPLLSMPQEIGPTSVFYLATFILGMHASYRHMAAGAHYPEDQGHPRSGCERRGHLGLGLGFVRVEI